ncbi:hypothetical protein SAM40697_5243 [Streptomyces ambofaciens]|uniref:Uncharacterized protein n=1 Tax=Streptomyces ambofaciens TaxID=1889 RepID=A0ABM6B5U1_STRAM|nr:hypothetical protein [Streptomyces ambofaciens]ANB09199.1 hypothetical protein SAM40697_5243 [Streptomyces ambofaciens]
MAREAPHATPHGPACPADDPPDILLSTRDLHLLPRTALVEALLRNAGEGAGPRRPRWESAV